MSEVFSDFVYHNYLGLFYTEFCPVAHYNSRKNKKEKRDS